MSWYVTHILSFNDPWSYPRLLAFPVEVLSLFFALHFSLIQAFWVLGNCSATAHSIFTKLCWLKPSFTCSTSAWPVYCGRWFEQKSTEETQYFTLFLVICSQLPTTWTLISSKLSASNLEFKSFCSCRVLFLTFFMVNWNLLASASKVAASLCNFFSSWQILGFQENNFCLHATKLFLYEKKTPFLAFSEVCRSSIWKICILLKGTWM